MPVRCRRIGALLAVGLSFVSSWTGCIIAEAPTDPPRLPLMRPTIVHTGVVPPTSKVLARFPDKFSVPVELSDRTLSFQWAAFVDYNPATGETLDSKGTSEFDPSTTEGRVRTVEIPIQPPSTDGCHVIEVVVGLQLGETTIGAHTPSEPPGGDIVTWFYNPSGDLGGCPTLDAGIDAAPPDAAEDGGPK